MTTIDNIMALADAYKDAYGREEVKDTREALLTALTEALAQPARKSELQQALTDTENQPNQYGLSFLMQGQNMAFKIGNQQFALDYEPTDKEEFEFMRNMLIHAMYIFTPDVKEAQSAREPLTPEQIADLFNAHKKDLVALVGGAAEVPAYRMHIVRMVERAHGIGGEK